MNSPLATSRSVAQHRADVWRHLRFLGAPAATAEDLTQETLMVWLRRAGELDGDRDLGPWLRGTARNLWRNACRNRRPEVLGLSDRELESAWQRLQGEDDGAARRDALRACLATLGGRARRAIELRYGEGASRERLGAALGVRPEGVKTMLRRLRTSLRACVQRRLESDD